MTPDSDAGAAPAAENPADLEAITGYLEQRVNTEEKAAVDARLASDPSFLELALPLAEAWVASGRPRADESNQPASAPVRVSWTRRFVGRAVAAGLLGATAVVGYILYANAVATDAQSLLPAIDFDDLAPVDSIPIDTAADRRRAEIDSAARRAARTAVAESVAAARKQVELASAPASPRVRVDSATTPVTTPASSPDTTTAIRAEEPPPRGPERDARRDPPGGLPGEMPLAIIRVPWTSRSKVKQVGPVPPHITNGQLVSSGKNETVLLPLPDGGRLNLQPESGFIFDGDSAQVMNAILTGEAVLEVPPGSWWQIQTVGGGFNLGPGRYALRAWKAEDGAEISIERGRVYAAGDSVVGVGVFARVTQQPHTLTKVEDGSAFPVIVPPDR
jgi:hypothetical protein